MNNDCPLKGKIKCTTCKYFYNSKCILLEKLNNPIVLCIGDCQECMEIKCPLHPYYIEPKLLKKKIKWKYKRHRVPKIIYKIRQIIKILRGK